MRKQQAAIPLKQRTGNYKFAGWSYAAIRLNYIVKKMNPKCSVRYDYFSGFWLTTNIAEYYLGWTYKTAFLKIQKHEKNIKNA